MNLFKKIIQSSLLLIVGLVSYVALAEEPVYIEQAHIILNLGEESDLGAAGAILAFPCEGCAPLRLEINDQTRVYLNGSITDFEGLGNRIDWEGMVFYLPGRFPLVTELFLN